MSEPEITQTVVISGSFKSRRTPQETTVFVRYTNRTKIPYQEEWALRKKFDEWLMKNVDYRIDFGAIDGTRVGVYLEPQDALAFKLAFGLED